jgi:hypothetical protein
MNSDVNSLALARFADRRHALFGKGLDRIWGDVDLQVKIPHLMLDRGLDAILDFVFLSEVDSDSVAQIHLSSIRCSSYRLCSGKVGRPGLSDIAIALDPHFRPHPTVYVFPLRDEISRALRREVSSGFGP